MNINHWDENSVVSAASSRTEVLEESFSKLNRLNQKVGSLQEKQRNLEEKISFLGEQNARMSMKLNILETNQSTTLKWAKQLFGMAGNRIEKLEQEVNSPMHLISSPPKKISKKS